MEFVTNAGVCLVAIIIAPCWLGRCKENGQIQRHLGDAYNAVDNEQKAVLIHK